VRNAQAIAPDVSQADALPEYNVLGSGIRMIASLMAVLALIVGSVFLLKKVIPYRGITANGKHSIMVLSRLSLGQKKSICLVRVADEILVIGLTNTNMSLLSKMRPDDYYGEGGQDTYEASKASSQFRSLMGTLQAKLRRDA